MHLLSTLALFSTAAVVPVIAAQCNHDNCLRNVIDQRFVAKASAFCATYTASVVTEEAAIPTYLSGCKESSKRVSSACSCAFTAQPTTSSSTTTTTTTTTTPAPTTTSPPVLSTTLVTSTLVASTTTSAAVSLCTATNYAQIAPAVASCTNIVLKDIFAPSNSSIDLSKLLPNSVVTFDGLTTFAFTNRSSFDPIIIAGKNITIQGAPGHLIEGNGHAYWDGIGSNGGVPKYV